MELSHDERLRRFEALVHASPDFIALADVDGQVSFVNAAGRRLAGIPDDVDVTRTTIADYLTPEGLKASEQVEQPAVLADGMWTGETTLRDWRDDSGIPVEVTSFLVADVRTGEPMALATIQRDLRPVQAAGVEAERAWAALQASERRQRMLLLHMSDVLVVLGADGVLQYASPSAGRLLGYAEGAALGADIETVLHPDDRAASRAGFVELIKHPGPSGPFRLRLLTGDGQVRHYEALANNLLLDPDVRGVVITARDINERVRAEQGQAAQTHVLELMASGADLPDVLAVLTGWVEGQFDDTLCSILLTEGPAHDPRLRQGASPSMPASYRAAVDAGVPAIAASPCATAVREGLPVLVPDLLGDERWAASQGLARTCGLRSCWSFPVLSPATGATLGTFALYRPTPGMPDDATKALIGRASHLVGISVDRSRLLSRLAYQAHHDALTGLPNRLQLLSSLGKRLRDAQLGGPAPVVVLLDLDRLKIINDSLGHDVGDELLVSIANRLGAGLQPGDEVARFGGDEFVVLSSATDDREDVDRLVVRILATVSEVVVLEGRSVTPGASAGVVVAEPHQTATEVLRDADIAMYRAKHRGGSGYALFDQDMRQRAFDRLDLEAQIRHGLVNGEFRLHYQPIVDLHADDAIVGFEALVRWEHPQRGLLGPAAFIDLAEETGLVVPLGEWVLRTAVADAAAWARHTSVGQLSMAVNLAAQQVAAPGLTALVEECAAAIAPWTLGLEFTESTLMDDTAAVRRVVDDLAAVGAEMSIDDFGTGYSSLSYLTRLPVRRLKIDRSFIADLDQRPEAATVAAAIISLAGELGMTVVAEGVETLQQRELLQSLGCRLAQGYLFGRPVAGEQALALLTGHPGRAQTTG